MTEILTEVKNKKERPEPEIKYKEVHGQMVPVKVYPTLPLEDKFDKHVSGDVLFKRNYGPDDYVYKLEIAKSMSIEYISKLSN